MADGRWELLSPVGEVAAATEVLAPRRGSLGALRVGFLSNNKPNVDLFFERLAERLEGEYGARVTLCRQKASHSVPAPPEMLEELAAGCDAVVNAVGD